MVFYSGQEAGGRPLSIDIPTALPGDEHVTRYELLLIEADSGIVKRVERPPLHAVRMYDTPFSAGLAWWSADGERIYVADIERGEKSVEIIEVNGSSGAARSVFTEESVSYLELSVDVYGPTLARFLPATEELLWYSERSGNGHLYLYDLKSGRLKRQVTEGDWRVRSVLSVDEARRDVLLLAAGLKDGLDPYLRTPCVASLDYGVIRPLCDDDNDHIIWSHDDYALLVLAISGGDNRDISGVSPRGDRLIETVAKIGAFPRTVIRSRCGEVIAEVERATPKHLAQDWEWPIPFEAVAADGQTPIFGLLFKPPPALLSERTPIIDYIYGGPQLSFVPKSAFADPFSDFIFAVPAALSRLGFAVTVIDGRGSAYRDRKFREHSFGALERASDVDDHVAALNQLARQHPWIDLNRVGVTGFSGGGYGAALAAFRRPDVFKVAVACSGNYDQRLFWHSWGERYQGAQSVEQFSAQAASTYAAGLRGKILFIHGLLDSGCHPAGLFQLLQSLIEHNKDYDLFVMPNVAHEVPGIAERRRFDYFVRHLLNETPPTNVSIATDIDLWKPRLAAAMAARSGATS
ncbi:MAG: hypothetical protein A4S17_02670 [Proteobacteria bacterium HN_bin10]|nr:MAG: hypothetical protein A4S17_02670 [Proteobacteria bacterium HN_bin10]